MELKCKKKGLIEYHFYCAWVKPSLPKAFNLKIVWKLVCVFSGAFFACLLGFCLIRKKLRHFSLEDDI